MRANKSSMEEIEMEKNNGVSNWTITVLFVILMAALYVASYYFPDKFAALFAVLLIALIIYVVVINIIKAGLTLVEVVFIFVLVGMVVYNLIPASSTEQGNSDAIDFEETSTEVSSFTLVEADSDAIDLEETSTEVSSFTKVVEMLLASPALIIFEVVKDLVIFIAGGFSLGAIRSK